METTNHQLDLERRMVGDIYTSHTVMRKLNMSSIMGQFLVVGLFERALAISFSGVMKSGSRTEAKISPATQ